MAKLEKLSSPTGNEDDVFFTGFLAWKCHMNYQLPSSHKYYETPTVSLDDYLSAA